MKSKFFKTLLTSAILTCLLSGVGGSVAMAQSAGNVAGGAADTVIPPPISPVPIPIGGSADSPMGWDGSMNPILNSMNITLNTKLGDLGQYLHGNENMGNGLIELLMSINSKLGQQNAFDNSSISQADELARTRLKTQGEINDALQRGVALDGSSIHNEEQACEEMTFASGRGAAASTTRQAKQVLTQVFDENIQDSRSGLNNIGRLYAQHSNTYCSEEDVQNKRPGCSKVGDYPGADIQATSLTTGATQSSGTPTNVSFNADQVKAALAYINTVTPMVPSDAAPSSLNSPDGKMYQTELNRYRARVSGVTDGYLDQLALRAQPDAIQKALQGQQNITYSTVNPSVLTNEGFGSDGQQNWASVESKYKQIFGSDTPFPSKPSEWEVLRYDVFSRYADASDANSWQAQVASFTEQQGVQELDRMTALSLRLQLMSIEQQQETNRLLQLIASNQLDPMTAQELRSQSAGLTSTNSATPAAQ